MQSRHLYLGVGVAVAAFILFANDGFRNLIVRTREQHRLQSILGKLRTDHVSLSEEWNRIQKDPTYSEYLIRRNLGYVKKGEVEYRILVSSHT